MINSINVKDILQRCKRIVARRWYSKYSIALVCFLVWVLFFNKYNFAMQRNLSDTVTKLERDKVQLAEDISLTQKQLEEIELHKERYAREHYYMHKPNEEIVVINPEE